MKQYLILFKEKADKRLLVNCNIKREFKNLPKIVVVEAPESEIEKLKTNDKIESISEDEADEFDEISTANTQQESYALDMLQAEKFWERGYYGQGVKIAVLDGGCQSHEDLNITGGFNAFDPSQPYMSDYRDHGTHVAGIINMQHNDRGYMGIAPEAELYVVKMDNNQGGSNGVSAQVAGVNWAIENDMDIISMSVSGTSDNAARREAFRSAAEDHGIICVTSASNQQRGVPISENTMRYPARYPFVVGVANIDENKKRWESSSVGDGLDISAPGVDIISTCPDPINEISQVYCYKTGTSMSTPYIAGMFALYKQMFPELGREELIKKMKENAEPLGSSRETGAGLAQFPGDNAKNIQMKKKEGDLWANLFPTTLAENVFDNEGNSLQTLLALLGSEVGENENGHYVRFDNGLQICWAEVIENNCDGEFGDIYRSSESANWTFPMPFKDNNLFISAFNPGADRWAEPSGTGNTNPGRAMPFRLYSAIYGENYSSIRTFAIGLWK